MVTLLVYVAMMLKITLVTASLLNTNVIKLMRLMKNSVLV